MTMTTMIRATTASSDESENLPQRSLPKAVIVMVVVVSVAIGILVAWSLTQSVVRLMSFDSELLEQQQRRSDRATAANVCESVALAAAETARAVRSLPQNSWWTAQQQAQRMLAATVDSSEGSVVGDGATTVFYANITSRKSSDDGLIVVRPLGWYVYYIRGGNFYYLTTTFANGGGGRSDRARCKDQECSVLVLEPEERDSTQRPRLRTACLGTTRLELLAAFAHSDHRRLTVNLDRLLDSDVEDDADGAGQSGRRVTLIDVLNELLERRVL